MDYFLAMSLNMFGNDMGIKILMENTIFLCRTAWAKTTNKNKQALVFSLKAVASIWQWNLNVRQPRLWFISSLLQHREFCPDNNHYCAQICRRYKLSCDSSRFTIHAEFKQWRGTYNESQWGCLLEVLKAEIWILELHKALTFIFFLKPVLFILFFTVVLGFRHAVMATIIYIWI